MSVHVSQPNEASAALRSQLIPTESLLWAGQPGRGEMLRWWQAESIVTAALILPLLAIGIVWFTLRFPMLTPTEYQGDAVWLLLRWVIPALIVASALVRPLRLFVRTAALRRVREHTYYGVTSNRLLLLVDDGRGRRSRALNISDIRDIDRQVTANGSGTITFEPMNRQDDTFPSFLFGMGTRNRRRYWPDPTDVAGPLIFDEIPDAAHVHELVSSLRPAAPTNRWSPY